MQCAAPSSPPSSTEVTADARKKFHDALHAEQAFQAAMMIPLTINGDYVYQRNVGFEFLILQAKLRRALAEIELYTAAIENTRQFEFSDNTGESPSHVFFDC